MFRVLAKPGLVILLCLGVSGVAFAQDVDSFVRPATISKRNAVILSAVFPGLGQMTAGSKVKGMSLFAAEMLSLAVFINASEDYATKLDAYNLDKDNLEALGSSLGNSYDDASELFADLKLQSNKLDDLHRSRNAALMVAAGVYAYSLFDAVFLTSYDEDGRTVEKLQGVTVESVMLQKTPGILISKRF